MAQAYSQGGCLTISPVMTCGPGSACVLKPKGRAGGASGGKNKDGGAEVSAFCSWLNLSERGGSSSPSRTSSLVVLVSAAAAGN